MKRVWSVLAAFGAGLVVAGVLIPAVAHAQTPPPSGPPDLGLPPVDTRPPAAATGGDSTRQRSNTDDGSFGASFVHTFTKPGGLLGALIVVLVVGVGVVAALRLTRAQRRSRRRGSRSGRGQESFGEPRARITGTDRQERELLVRVSDRIRMPVTEVKELVDKVRGPHWSELPEARRHDVLDRISSSTEELDRLVGQLWDLGRLDRARATLKPRPVLVSEAVERTLMELGPVLDDHSVYLDIPDGLAMLADDAAFHEVLANVVDNAVKFSPADRRILISATRADGAVDISVADEGSGIAPKEQARIFEPFYQSSQNGEPRRGIGLGLTIAKRLTELQGGQLAVVSEVGLGSTFWITMPVAAGPARRFENHQHNARSRSGTRPRPSLPLPDLRSRPPAGG